MKMKTIRMANMDLTPFFWRCLLVIGCSLCWESAEAKQELTEWSVSLDDGQTFQPISVPGTIEDQIDVAFDGVAIYQTDLPRLELQPGQRFVLHFQAVATAAKVFVGQQLVAEHLGGWTPFSVDLAWLVAPGSSNEPVLKLRVEVDEKVGHNTQGFLPIVTNHFGGIWQPVSWQIYEQARILTNSLAVRGNLAADEITFIVPVNQPREFDGRISYSIRPANNDADRANDQWFELNPKSESVSFIEPESVNGERITATNLATCPIPFPLKAWSPESAQRYEIRIQLVDGSNNGDRTIDTFTIPVGFRDFVADGDQFRLNGHPIGIRGVLNWGYAPPSVAPSLDEAWMRAEIEFAKSRGFNLMKFCLWIPPKRYLELCDELGMLAWMEYPAWHPQFDQQHLAELRQEYTEFYEYDRNHASIVLRSLTCETGPGADLAVIQSLYDQCKSYIPDAVIEDDSSWIAWNRVHDFYDDHPYGNNQTWVATLSELKSYIGKHELQPLVLGEAIAADTWTVPDQESLDRAKQQPAHGAWAVRDNLRWQNSMTELANQRDRRFDPGTLLPQSRHYGLLMRKFQIETYQREVPHGGYVVSVIRDFPKAAMGLIDYNNRAKTIREDWQFQSDAMLILQTRSDRRSFDSGQQTRIQLIAKNSGPHPIDAGKLTLELLDGSRLDLPQPATEPFHVVLQQAELAKVESGSSGSTDFGWTMPAVRQPKRFVLQARWDADGTTRTNQWPIWVLPVSPEVKPTIAVHDSAQGIAGCLPIVAVPWNAAATDGPPVLTRRLDEGLLQHLKNGGKVFMLPDGEPGSFATSNHWFLRRTPAVLPRSGEQLHQPFEFLHDGKPEQQNMLIELQHFDLAGPVITNIDHYLELTDPFLVLWDNHDATTVKTHGLVFEMGVGQSGQLFVSALNHVGETNSVGRWLFEQWCQRLVQQDSPPHLSLETRRRTLDQLSTEINRKAIDLHSQPWRFRPDPDLQGVTQKWFAPAYDDQAWSMIRVDRHWEGQGYEALDHWAWYRTSVTLPGDWDAEKSYLNFTGIDDYADIYVNGEKIGSVGNIEQKLTAFEERISFDVTQWAQPGQPLQIAVAVYDWYGAGGIFRPVTLSTTPLSENPPILK